MAPCGTGHGTDRTLHARGGPSGPPGRWCARSQPRGPRSRRVPRWRVPGAARRAPTAPTAQTGSPVATVVVHDPVDTAGGFDLTRVQVGRASDGRMRAALTLAAPWRMRDLPADDGPPGSLCLRMWTVTKGEAAFPDRLLCMTADARRQAHARLDLRRARRHAASASRPRASPAPATARWSPGFSQSAIGRPVRVRFAAEATPPGLPARRVHRHGAERAGGRRADVAFRPDPHRGAPPRAAKLAPFVPCSFPVMPRSPLIALLATAGALAVPATAAAEVIEVGAVPPASPASCPSRPCLAVSRTTGYQAKVGTDARRS